MASQNRGQKIKKLLTQLKKQFKPAPPPPKNRTLLEHLLFACLLENSPQEDAEQVFETLQKEYYDWNEVRVTTRRELAEVMKRLVDPAEAAERLKKTLHNTFEAVYAFELEPLKKQNLGQATKQLEALEGTTPFGVAYCVQHSLGGHAIPVNRGLLIALETLDVITPAEAAKGVVPGLERTVPKAKGPEIASLVHQLGVEVGRNPHGQSARKLLLTIDPGCKDRLPKRPSKAQSDGEADAKAPADTPATAAAAKKKPAPKAERAPSKKSPAASSASNKPAKPAKKTPTAKKTKSSKRLTKKKPR